MPDPRDWQRSPGQGRYARPERERRFLVAEVPALLEPLREVEDRYLDGTALRLRTVRVGDEVLHKLTQKVRARPQDPSATALTNLYLTGEEHALLAQLPAATLRKVRGVVADEPRWVVDRFDGELTGLVLAEVELDGDEDLPLPGWLGREVTRDDRYSGGELARAGAARLARLLDRQEQGPLAPFVEGRRLRSLPAAPDRRWNVLAHVATHALETGRDYDEREVTERLQQWCEGGEVDAVALRRYLVEQGLVSRGGGTYRLGSDGPEPSPGERMVRGLGLS